MGQQKINVNANGKNGSFIGVVGCFSVLGVDVGFFFLNSVRLDVEGVKYINLFTCTYLTGCLMNFNCEKYTLILALIISNTGEPHEQRGVFNADVVGSACHVVVDADSTGNSGRLTFGTYRNVHGSACTAA